MTVLEQIGEKLVAARERSLSQSVRENLAIHLLDTVGAWIAGRVTEEGSSLTELKSPTEDGVSALGNTVLDRIALGVATIRLTEIDDIHMASCTTPSSVVVPTALAIAARFRHPTVHAFARALNAGYEVMTHFGVAADGPHVVYRGVWPTCLVAPCSAAAVTATLFGMDAEKTANALAIACTLTYGATGIIKGLSPRPLLLGFASRAGCVAALMAHDGYAGDRSLLDGDWMLRMHGVAYNVSLLPGPDETDDAINRVGLKPYCSAKQCTAAIEAFQHLLAQGINPDEIVSLRVVVPPAYASMISHQSAKESRVGRITNVAYNLALAAYVPDGLSDISRPNLTGDPKIATLMEKVEVHRDEAMTQYYPQRWPALIEATMKNGRPGTAMVTDSAGDPTRPLERSQVREKFLRLTDSVIGRDAALRLADSCIAATTEDEALAHICTWVNAY